MDKSLMRVLLVEDDPDDVLLLREALGESAGENGYEVISAERLVLALRFLAEQRFDIVLLDLGLPDSAGLETLQRLLGQAAGAPVVVLSGMSDEDLAAQAVQSGAQDYIAKHDLTHALLTRTIRYAVERHQGQAALRASEQHYRALIENSASGLALISKEGAILFESPAVRGILGYTPEETLGKNFFSTCHPDDAPIVRDSADRLLENPGAPIYTQARYLHKDGSYRWIEAICTNLLEEPNVRAVVVNYHDVSERKQAEQALRDQVALQNQLTNIAATVPGLVCAFQQRLDGSYSMPYASPAIEDLYGLTLQDVLDDASPIFALMVPEDREHVMAAIQESAAEMIPWRAEWRMNHPKRGEIWLEGHSVPHRESDGSLLWHGFVQDITERKRAEQILREREAQYRAVIESSADGFWVLDRDSRILEVNDAYVRRSGYPREDLLGMRVAEIDTKFTPEATAQHLETVRQTGSALFTTLHRARSGEIWNVEVNISYWPIRGGRFFVFLRDINKRARAEALMHFRLRLSEMARTMSLDDFIRAALDRVERATTSQVAYFHFVDEQTGKVKLQSWSTNTVTQMCKAKDEKTHYSIDQAGVWADSVRTRAPVIHNDFPNLAEKKGMPEGHAPIQRHLSVPILQEEHVMAVLGVGNKAVDYIQDDVDMLSEMAVMLTDVVLRKQAEEALRLSEQKFATAFRTSPDAISINRTSDGLYLEINDGFTTLTGYTLKDVEGKTTRDINIWVNEEDRLRLKNLLEEHDQVVSLEMNFRWKDGSVHTGMLSGRNIIIEGEPCILTITRDITERKLAEAALRASEERYRSLAEAAEDTIFIIGPDGVFHYVNQAAAALLERDPSAIIGHSNREFFSDPAIIEQESRHIQKVFQSSVPVSYENSRTVGGSTRWWNTLLVPLRRPDGAVAEVLGISREMTERRQAEEEIRKLNAELEQRVIERTADLRQANEHLEKASQAKDEFLASMSHELRTPLNAILNFAESMEEGIYGPLDERQVRPVQTITESGQHLLALINDVLDFSKTEARQMRLELRQVAIEPVCQSSLHFVRAQARKKRLQIFFNMDPGLATIAADERALKQILVNLLSNAVKFTPDGGQIGLRVLRKPEQNAVHFVVWDTGIGIAPEKFELLFKPFVQLDSGLSKQFGGSGLGLALVYRMVELHGGSIMVESQPGEGSSFTISLPLGPESSKPVPMQAFPAWGAPQPQMPAPKLRAGPPPLVLLVEDNLANQSTYADYLAARGFRVALAENGFEAIERCRADRPVLVLMDIQMPGMDGLEAIRRLRADPALADMPIIALTALAMPGDRERCLAAGANNYLAKPIRLKTLVQMIEAYID